MAWFHASFEAGASEVAAYVATWGGGRSLDCADLFSASKKVADVWKSVGYEAASADIVNPQKNFDVISREGFFNTLDLCLAVKQGGFALAGPPCSLFVFLSSSTHRRTAQNPDGDTSHFKVRMANAIAKNCCALLRTLAGRQVLVMLEQPTNSMMFKLGCIARWMEEDRSLFVVHTYLGAFDHPMIKPTHLLTSMNSAVLLKRQKSKAQSSVQSIEPLAGPLPARATENPWARPQRTCGPFLRNTPSGPSGTRQLHMSAECTTEFVWAVLCAWERERGRMDSAA